MPVRPDKSAILRASITAGRAYFQNEWRQNNHQHHQKDSIAKKKK
jgi:hypothetical protein